MTKTTDRDALQERATNLETRAAEARAELQAQADREAERERERQRKADEKLVESYRTAPLDEAVDQARAALDQAVADSPLTHALADLIAAGFRRNWAAADVQAAWSRLGRQGDGPRIPDPVYVPELHEAIARAAERLAQAQIDAERANRED